MALIRGSSGGKKTFAARCCALAAIFIALPVLANEKARLVLVADPQAELTRRLHAEAAEVGLVLVDEPAGWQGDSLRTIPVRHAALGVLRVLSSSGVELWLLPHEGPPHHEVIRAQPDEGDSFAVRVVEEVRARLVELRLPVPEGPAGSRESKPQVKALSADAGAAVPEQRSVVEANGPEGRATRRRVIEASGGLGATAAAGGMGTTLQGALALHVNLAARWRATAQALLPLSANGFSAGEGAANVHVFLFTGQVDYVWLRRSNLFSASMGAGGGGLILAMRGEGAPGYAGKNDRLAAAVFFLDASASADLATWLSLRASVLGGAAAPRPVVRFDGHEAASWGRSFAAGIIALDFALGGGGR